MKKYYLILSALFLVACTSSKTATTQTNTVPQGTKFQTYTKPQAYTAEQLNHGKELYAQHCSTCHNLKKPTSETAKDWREIVPEMVAKANKRNQNAIDANTQEVILNYLVAMSTSDTK